MYRTRWPPQWFPTLSFYAWYCPTAEKVLHKNWVFLLGEEGAGRSKRWPSSHLTLSPPPAMSPGPVIVVLQDPLFFLVPLALTPILDSIVLRVPEQETWPYLAGVLGTNDKKQTFPPFTALWALKGKATCEMDKVVTKKNHGCQQQTQTLPCTGSEEKCWT